MEIYTVGHSKHSMEDLLQLLRAHEITCLVDVRSQPYSRWAPQYNRKALAQSLKDAGIDYRFMGNSLGGRPSDTSLYRAGGQHAHYGRIAQTKAYQDSISELLDLAQTQHIVAMCSEHDHTHCHRHLLIAQTLLDHKACVLHIQRDGTVVKGERIPTQPSLLDE